VSGGMIIFYPFTGLRVSTLYSETHERCGLTMQTERQDY